MNYAPLEHRLRRRGRRSGIMIGFSMLAAMSVLIGGFVVLFSALDPIFTDFTGQVDAESVSRSAPRPTVVPEVAAATEPAQQGLPLSTGNQPTATAPSEPAPTSTTSTEFTADYRVSANQRINLRSGPGTSFSVVVVLAPGTPLQFEEGNEDQQSLPPDRRWLRFSTESGEEGWIREIDVENLAP